jgi:hypothetical protein
VQERARKDAERLGRMLDQSKLDRE